ncbi:MAG: hypothetical protein Hyperionvirus13_54, partial [Hyperionvirus sp.]
EHTIYFYGHDRSVVACDELIPITNDEILTKYYGKFDKDQLIKYGNLDADGEFNKKCIFEIGKRKQPKDFILCFWGIGHKEVTDHFSDCIAVEPSIGYPSGSIFAKHKVFESYSYMHYIYGNKNITTGEWYDAVIPNYFDITEFNYKETKQDYMLYLGRIFKNKGIDICIQLAEKLGIRLIIAGTGDIKSLGYDTLPDNIVCVGSADVDRRKELMSNAKCLLLPTYYIEPFGNVIIEAFLSGTPVITTDWGAFTETNIHGLTGYRCRTFEQFTFAVKNIDKIKASDCREWAIKNYSMDRVKHMYQEYFDMLSKLYNTGFYEENPNRKELAWLNKTYPQNKEYS